MVIYFFIYRCMKFQSFTILTLFKYFIEHLMIGGISYRCQPALAPATERAYHTIWLNSRLIVTLHKESKANNFTLLYKIEFTTKTPQPYTL